VVGAGCYSLVGFLHAISGGTVSVLVFFFFATPSPTTSRPRLLQSRSSCSNGAPRSWTQLRILRRLRHTITRNGCAAKTESRRWSGIGFGQESGGAAVASPPLPPLPRQSGYVRRSVTTHTIVISWTRWIGARVLVEALDSSVPVLQGLVTLSTAWWDASCPPSLADEGRTGKWARLRRSTNRMQLLSRLQCRRLSEHVVDV